jgi:hypothetical protein
MSGAFEEQVPLVLICARKLVLEQSACVLVSVDLKLPAMVLLLVEERAVASNPQRRALGSATVTTQCCFCPGV